MNTVKYKTNRLEAFLGKKIIATMPEMKQALGTTVGKTVMRKLKELSYRTSYSHGSRYYTLDALTQFNEQGLWAYHSVWFSQRGTLLSTLRHFVPMSETGYSANELAACLHVSVKESLLKLVKNGQIVREKISGIYVYCSLDSRIRKKQLINRQINESEAEVFSDEVKAAILLFICVLDEKQRRLFAGLESLKMGLGGDKSIAETFGLHFNTVARGRRELLKREIEPERTRKKGGGRKPVEKKHQKSSRN
jgi:hypothetical protein